MTVPPEIIWTGAASVQNATLASKAVPELRFERASCELGSGFAKVGPVNMISGGTVIGSIAATYSLNDGTFEVDLNSEGGALTALLQSFPAAPVPLLSALQSGSWRGDLKYVQTASGPGQWAGAGTLTNAIARFPLLAQPVEITSSRVHVDGPAILMDHLRLRAGGAEVGGEYR